MSGVLPPTLLEATQQLAGAVPGATCVAIARAIASIAPEHWGLLRLRSGDAAGGPQGRELVGELLRQWRDVAPNIPPMAIAAALEGAAAAFGSSRAAQTLELVWTGPPTALPLRRTAQALQQVIDEAERDLLIVSYTAYQIPDIGRALARATDRGVALNLVIESPREVDGHVAYDGLLAFSQSIRDHAHIYRWPPARRARDAAGSSGALHVKCAVADGRLLLISSANLTHHALNLNMELGVLVRGGDQPRLVARHFAELIQTGTLVRMAAERAGGAAGGTWE